MRRLERDGWALERLLDATGRTDLFSAHADTRHFSHRKLLFQPMAVRNTTPSDRLRRTSFFCGETCFAPKRLSHLRHVYDEKGKKERCRSALDMTGQNRVHAPAGHNYIGHNYSGHDYIGHNYVGHH